jgi:hypothetical protein
MPKISETAERRMIMAFYCNGKKDLCDCDILCADCQHYDNTGGKKWQTNADRFRAMSDDEQQRCVRKFWEIEDFADWLQQPAEVPKGD